MRKTYYTGPRNGELKAALQLLFNNLSDNLWALKVTWILNVFGQ